MPVDAERGFDVMQSLARPLPARVIATLMGVDAADSAEFMAWSDDLAAFIGEPQPTHDQARRAQTSLLAMGRWFEALLPRRRRFPGDDLVSLLLQAEAAGEIQAGPELLAQCAMLLFAGHETPRNLLGNGLRALLAHPRSGSACSASPRCCPGPCANCYVTTVQCRSHRLDRASFISGIRPVPA